MLNAKQIKELDDKLYNTHEKREKQLMTNYFNEYKWGNMSEDKVQMLVDKFKEQIYDKMHNDTYRDDYFVMPSSRYPVSYANIERRINVWIESEFFPELKDGFNKQIPELDEEIEQEKIMYREMQDLLYSHPNEDEVNTIFEYIASNVTEPVCV